MIDILWRLAFSAAIGVLVWLAHSVIGEYPQPLPRAPDPRQQIRDVLCLWGVVVAVSAVMPTVVTPWLERVVADRMLGQLGEATLRTIPYLALPLFIVLRRDQWTRRDLGLRLRPRSASVTFYALGCGIGSGWVAYVSGQSVIGVERFQLGELLLLVYSNAFLEEFYHRGVIQSKLERALGQRRALLWGGVMFGLTHVVFDISMLLETSGAVMVLFAVLLQTMAGWLFGIIYMKTRSLWPGMACHYLGNWLPSILVALLG